MPGLHAEGHRHAKSKQVRAEGESPMQREERTRDEFIAAIRRR
jgi:hypothetical protein